MHQCNGLFADFSGKSGTSGSGQVLPQTSEQQKSVSATSPSHRRILCFDVTPETLQLDRILYRQAHSRPLLLLLPQLSRFRKKWHRLIRNSLFFWYLQKKNRNRYAARSKSKAGIKNSEKVTIFHQQKEAPKSKVTEKGPNLIAVSNAKSSNKAAIEPEALIRSESPKKSQALQKEDGGVVSKSSAPGIKQKPAGNTKDSTLEESREKKQLKPAERSSEKAALQNSPGVTANKENELESCQHQTLACPTEDVTPSLAKSTAPVSSSSSKTLCKTSPLTKQAVEMLQDIQARLPRPLHRRDRWPGVQISHSREHLDQDVNRRSWRMDWEPRPDKGSGGRVKAHRGISPLLPHPISPPAVLPARRGVRTASTWPPTLSWSCHAPPGQEVLWKTACVKRRPVLGNLPPLKERRESKLNRALLQRKSYSFSAPRAVKRNQRWADILLVICEKTVKIDRILT